MTITAPGIILDKENNTITLISSTDTLTISKEGKIWTNCKPSQMENLAQTLFNVIAGTVVAALTMIILAVLIGGFTPPIREQHDGE